MVDSLEEIDKTIQVYGAQMVLPNWYARFDKKLKAILGEARIPEGGMMPKEVAYAIYREAMTTALELATINRE